MAKGDSHDYGRIFENDRKCAFGGNIFLRKID